MKKLTVQAIVMSVGMIVFAFLAYIGQTGAAWAILFVVVMTGIG